MEPSRGLGGSRAAAGTPSLGVVVPTLNEREVLPMLLDRLLRGSAEAPPGSGGTGPASCAGSDRADQVVVVDGGSTDGTAELARAGGATVLHTRPGRGAQLAAGAAVLDTDLLLFLHADALPDPGALAAVRRAFQDPGVGRSAMVQRISAPGRFYRGVERTASRRARRGLVYGDSGLCLRREVHDGVGGFRDLPVFEDLDLARRLMAWPAAGRMVLVENAVLRLSPRRWRKEGPLRCTLRNWTLTRAWRLGVSPKFLARCYPPHA